MGKWDITWWGLTLGLSCQEYAEPQQTTWYKNAIEQHEIPNKQWNKSRIIKLQDTAKKFLAIIGQAMHELEHRTERPESFLLTSQVTWSLLDRKSHQTRCPAMLTVQWCMPFKVLLWWHSEESSLSSPILNHPILDASPVLIRTW